MLQITIEVTGITPLLCNQFTDQRAIEASDGSRGSSAGQDRGTPLEIAKSKLYLGLKTRKPMIPSPNLLRCLVEGGRFHKVGRSQITTQKSSMLFSCVVIHASEIPIIHKQDWKVDTRAVRIPATGGRILGHRPMFDDWKLKFELELDTRIIGSKLFRLIVDDAGNRIGLGDFRPATKGPYGRFNVTSWVQKGVELPPEEPMAEAAE